MGEGEGQYRAIFENSGTANALFDRAHRLVIVNSLGRDLLRLAPGEGIGRIPVELFGQDQGPSVAERLDRVFATGTAETHETEFSLPVGRRWYRTTYQPIIDDGGGIESIQTISQDITLQKRAESELRESESLFRFLVDNMQVALVLQGPHSEMLLCNHKALELLGLTRDQLLGKTSFDPDWNVIHEDGSPFPGPDHPVPRAIAERRPVLDEVMGVYRPTKGDRVWMLVDAVPRLDSGGAVRDVVCTFREFTDRKVAEDRVAALLREKELILREVHHRIKNNMGSMMGLLLFQAAGHQDPAVKEALEDAAGRLHSMGVLYERLYRSESIGTLSLADYLRSLAGAILEVLPGSERVRLEFAITDLPLDAKLLSSIGIIVNELISNSMKHAFAGRQGGTIRIEAAPLGSGIRLAFSDDGVGMPAKPVSEGNEGFGLQLVKSIVDQYRGTLTIQGGPGTRIVMELAGPF